MAISYTGSTGIFTHIGKVIKAVNACATDLTNWDTRESDIQTVYEAGGQQVAADPLIGYVNQIQTAIANIRGTLGELVTTRLQDYDSVVSQLGIPSNDIGSVLYALITQMNTDSASVNASAVTIGSITAGASNVGDGTILTNAYLDGASAPVLGGQAHPAYLNLLTEMSVPETMTFKCSRDSYTDGVTAGQESFSWNGQLALNGTWTEGTEGSGNGPAIQCLQAGTIISGMGFESWTTTNIPDGFAIDAGVVTVNVARESTTVYRGSYSAKLLGTGIAAVTIGQAVAASRLKPLKRYCCSIRYRASATQTSSQSFTVKFTGTGYTEGSTEKIVVLGDVFPTSWTLGHFWVTMPAAIPSDMRLIVSLAGSATVNMFVDDLGFAEATYHNGIAAAAVAGATNFVRGDSFTTAITVTAGVVQDYARRQFKVQLPSSGSPTIADSLAT